MSLCACVRVDLRGQVALACLAANPDHAARLAPCIPQVCSAMGTHGSAGPLVSLGVLFLRRLCRDSACLALMRDDSALAAVVQAAADRGTPHASELLTRWRSPVVVEPTVGLGLVEAVCVCVCVCVRCCCFLLAVAVAVATVAVAS